MTQPGPSSAFARSHIKIRQLVVVAALARHGSVLQAARAAHMTQPGASKLLRELEQALGVQLFERSSRGVVPTEYGSVLVRRATAALDEMRIAYMEVCAPLDALDTRVAVGALLTPALTLVAQAADLLRSRESALSVDVALDSSAALIAGLREGRYDIVVARMRGGLGADEFDFAPCAGASHVLVVGATHPLAGCRPTLAQLAACEWVLPSGEAARKRLHGVFTASGAAPLPEPIAIDDVEAALAFLMRGSAVALLPRAVLRRESARAALVQLEADLEPGGHYAIITRRKAQLSPAAAAMRDALFDCMPAR